ncbi:MAG: ABC transporter ATP-binding protein [Deltaproteobacteria bacterium]|jgi:branched-chain amino acid transport system ATP-binding protein|nr:ABC transporter ATP-binding protein [Deltaproteobacteria bacterium]
MDFGGLTALDQVSLTVERGSITALIGPNGAGKTTFFNCVTGIYKPGSGSIFFLPEKEKRISLGGLRPHKAAQLGIGRTFQNIRLFNTLTVLENVLIGCHARMRAGLWGALFRDRKTMEEERRMTDLSYAILERYGLQARVNDPAGSLPYGEQRRLEIARALASGPSLLLLDEPAAGLNNQETLELADLIRHIRRDEKLSVLLIEHDMSLVMNVSERINVLDYGRLIASGTPEEIRKNPDVVRAYLGEDADDLG